MQELCSSPKIVQEFKTPTSRLARLFRHSRDSWKKRAREKQKKLRALDIKVRDLSISRDYWKNRAKVAEEQLLTQNIEIGQRQKKTKSKEWNST